MNLDMPTIGSSTYASSVHNLAAVGAVGGNAALNFRNQALPSGFQQQKDLDDDKKLDQIIKNAQNRLKQQEVVSMTARRLVKVIIADPNENVPLADCVLYSGEEKMTDATDQELFFEIDIKNIIDTYNVKRIKLIDKKVKERTEYLEPAKVRDLKMVVVNIAQF
jgi:hypothetical protein